MERIWQAPSQQGSGLDLNKEPKEPLDLRKSQAAVLAWPGRRLGTRSSSPTLDSRSLCDGHSLSDWQAVFDQARSVITSYASPMHARAIQC
jgi:hypothetical protein